MSENTIDTIVAPEKAESADKIRNVLADGVRSYAELRLKTGIHKQDLRTICQYENIPVPSEIALYNPRQGLEIYVMQGLTLEKIGSQYGVTKARAGQLLLEGGLYVQWMKRKKELRAQKDRPPAELAELCAVFDAYLQHRLADVPWEVRKTVEYMAKIRRTRYTEHQLLNLFSAYARAKSSGTKLSLQNLGNVCHIGAPQISNILNVVGISPMYRKVQRQYVSAERKRSIRKCFGLHVPVADIAFLLGERTHVVSQVFRQMGVRQKQKKYALPARMTVSYRDASLMYLGLDIGLSIYEIAQDFEKKQTLVQYVLDRRNLIAPKIMEVIQTRYHNIKTPYR